MSAPLPERAAAVFGSSEPRPEDTAYQEARLALWEDTVIPLLRHLRDEFNAWLAPAFGAGLELDLDLDDIPALALRREKTWARIEAAGFLTLNEKRAAIGLPPRGDGDALTPPGGAKPPGATAGEAPNSGSPGT